MIDAFVCTNDVNYTIAVSGELRRRPRRALVLFDPVRCDRRALPGVWQLAFGPWTDRLMRLLGRLAVINTAFVPHHRVNPRLMREVRRARHIGYLDDGLDTLRHAPLNFDRDQMPAGRPPYLTFEEYPQLPAWLARFDVQRVCSLRELNSSGRKPVLDLQGVEHLFVESPGLDAGAVMAALQIDPRRALCVRHPVPHKRGSLPALCRTVEGRGHDLEATLSLCRGVSLYFGSTMALVFVLLEGAVHSNRVFVQLDDAQRANLLIPARLSDMRVPGLRYPLLQASALEAIHRADAVASPQPPG